MEYENFRVIRSLGVGATAEVLLARNLTTDKDVALKCLTPLLSQDEEALQRFLSEVEILASLDHPNIVRLLGKSSFGDRVALELEFVDGMHLGRWLKQEGCQLYEPKLWLLVQIARGLGAAHERGVIHRDLKPENILISKDGKTKITDFGLAKELGRMTMTRMGLLVGSLGYMAPELVNGEKATMASDNFSFGAIAYELLSGRPAFTGETPQSLLKAVVDKEVEPLQALCPYLPLRICNLIQNCLEKDPSHRPESIWQISGDIMNVLGRTRMIPFCQELVGQQVSPDSALATLERKALLCKYEALSEEKSRIEKNKDVDKSAVIRLANEFQTFFPDDPGAADFLLLLEPRNRKTMPLIRFVGIAVLILLLTLPWLLSWPTQNPESLSGVTSVTLENQNLKPSVRQEPSRPPGDPEPTKSPPSPVNPVKLAKKKLVAFSGKAGRRPPEKKSVQVKAKSTTRSPKKRGTLQFFVDEGVEVFVDDVSVPYEDLNNYNLSAGKHSVKLVKPGFLPILNSVFVRSGRVTQVRAKGGR